MTHFLEVSSPMERKPAGPESNELVSEGAFGDLFDLRLQSLAICNFEVAPIWVPKGVVKVVLTVGIPQLTLFVSWNWPV